MAGRKTRTLEQRILKKIGRARLRPRTVAYYPRFESQAEFDNHYHRARWYLPAMPGALDTVVMGVTAKYATTHRPDYMCGPRKGADAVVRETGIDDYVDALCGASMVLVWKECDADVVAALKARGLQVWNVTTDDPNSVEYGRYASLLWQLLGEEAKAELIARSQEQFLAHAEVLRSRGYVAAAVFGTGPTIDLARSINFERILTIACNTVVQDRALLKHLKPAFVSAGDVVSHLGVSKYAERYRDDLYRHLKSSDCYFLTTAKFAPLITVHYPEIAHRVLICEQGVRGPVFDLTRTWKLPRLDSVLNIHMLPLASTFANTIFLLGCDGKNPDETKNEDFWAHSEHTQYHELVESGHLAHPTFDINRQKSTFNRFLDSTSTSIDLGERHGNIYLSLAPSFTASIGDRAIEVGRLPRDKNGLYVPVVEEKTLRRKLAIEAIEARVTGYNGSELSGVCAKGSVDMAAYVDGKIAGWAKSSPADGSFTIGVRETLHDGEARRITLRAGLGGTPASDMPKSIALPRKRRVIIIGRVGRHGYSGGRYHALIAGEALAMMGHDVTLWITSTPPYFADFASLPKHRTVKVIHKPWDKPPGGRFDFVFIIPDSAYDGSVFEAAIKLAKRDNARMTFFNYESPNWYNSLSPAKRDPTEWYWWSRIARYCDVVLSSARTSQEFAEEYYDPDRLFRYAYPAINTVAADHAYSPSPAKKQIVIISRFGAAAGHKGMADVEAIITPALAGYTLAFVSGTSKNDDDSEIRRVQRLCEAAGARFKILKSVSDAQKFKEIGQSHFMVFPSYFEGFGYPPVEALYMGRPCICYDLPVLREITGGLANFVPKGDTDALRDAVDAMVAEADFAPRVMLRDGIRHTASVQRFGQQLQRIIDEAIYTLPVGAADGFTGALGRPASELSRALLRTERDYAVFAKELAATLVKEKPRAVAALIDALRAAQKAKPKVTPREAFLAKIMNKKPRLPAADDDPAELNQAWFVEHLFGAILERAAK